MTPARTNSSVSSAVRSGPYIVCLDCGREFSYDWKEMRVGEPLTMHPKVAAIRPWVHGRPSTATRMGFSNPAGRTGLEQREAKV